ncbi:MAG: assimilatory sulfite reductase (NADPH) hemoprotein subunit [Flavobacteriales bacterium]|nr:assimilatory sulfite reductase (NADPH) hemoprotein subunit [Flavobacteriales bacterium]
MELSPSERIKIESRGLRGTLKESLADDLTGALREDDKILLKHHGMYEQDDRDRREERAEKKLERLYSFMIRLRIPGGLMTAQQWIALHNIAGEHSTGTIKITTRQTVQLHGIIKSHMKPTLKSFYLEGLDSIAACGDVNRNVMCSSHPKVSAVHEEVFRFADKISTLALPKTRAYYEIWLDQEKLADYNEEDPLYKDTYLPRKFKIAIAIPPHNDVDVLANDIGLIAIIENNKLLGFNVAVGGGLSTTHGNAATYARLGTVIGFVSGEEKILKTVYEIITIQRDYGNRSDRKQARLKYTLDKMGVDNFKIELFKRSGFMLEPERSYILEQRSDYYGWQQNHEGLWYYTVFVENGRIVDEGAHRVKTALFEIAKTGKSDFRFTGNQNVMVSDVKPAHKNEIHDLLEKYGVIWNTASSSPVRKNSMACVAFPTCPLALAEAQRYMPSFISKVEPLLEKYGMPRDEIVIRMTGCPNGCGRPYLAEIGLVGSNEGRYNLHIGGDRLGLRLNTKYKENLNESEILSEIDSMFSIFIQEKNGGETFGDFSNRKWIAHQS